MSIVLNTPPAVEPITLDQAKAHLRLDVSDDDALVTALILAARARAEWHTGRAFVTQGWTLWLDCLPRVVEIPLPPLRAVSSVTTYGRDDGATALDAGQYQVDASSGPGRVAFGPNATHGELRAINAVAIAFTAGYGDADAVPAPVSTAILQIVAALYAHRGDEMAPMPDGAAALLAPYRMVRL